MNARPAALIAISVLAVSGLAGLGLAGCSLLGPAATVEPFTPSPDTPAGTQAFEPTAGPGTPESPQTPTGPAGTGLVTLRLWLPPRFSPDPSTAAGALLKARLDEFALLHPGIRITVRVKGEGGPGGMVASLDAIAGAVPDSLPDLVLIQRPEMERAIGAGLLIPFDEPLDLDWYDFARLLAEQDGSVYGLPFAGDALVLIYRPDVVPSPPKDWTTTISSPAALLLPGASQASYITLALYAAAGGELLDPDGRPVLSTPVLTALLDFYSEAVDTGVLTPASAGILSEAAAYESFRNGEVDLAVTWASHRLNDDSGNIAAATLPTVSAVPYTMMTGWMWALSNPDPERARLSAELAAFLTAPEFLAAWTEAAGAIPPRASSLAGWPDGAEAALASRLVLAAHPLPPLAVLETTGPALQAAVEAVLLGELSPAEAAAAAALRVNGP